MSSRRWAARNGFSRREVSRRAFPPTETGSPMGSRKTGGGRIYVAPAAGGPATPVAAGFYRAQAHVWSPDGRYLLFWGQRQRDAPPEDNVDWYVAAIPGGSPVPTAARSVLLREGFRAFQGLPFPDAWAGAGKPHPLSWQRRRFFEHVAGGHLAESWRVSGAAAACDVRHDGRSRRIGDLGRHAWCSSAGRWGRTSGAWPIDAERGQAGRAAEASDSGRRR